MVGVAAGEGSQSIVLIGHGLSIAEEYELAPGIMLSPTVPSLDLSLTVNGCASFVDYAATVHGHEIASFSIIVTEIAGGRQLVTKAWNALWIFRLLGLASRCPVRSLYSVSDGEKPHFVAANPVPIMPPLEKNAHLSEIQLRWAKQYYQAFLTYSRRRNLWPRCDATVTRRI